MNTKLSIVHTSAICQHTDSNPNRLSRDVSQNIYNHYKIAFRVTFEKAYRISILVHTIILDGHEMGDCIRVCCFSYLGQGRIF